MPIPNNTPEGKKLKYDVREMKDMRLKGKSLQFIGDYYKITRERVRQLLVKTYGSSIETDPIKRIAREVREYQWDSANAEREAVMIAKRIHTIFYPMRVDKKDPLSILLK